MKTLFRGVILLGLALVVVGGLTLGYFGFLPIVSKVLGTHSPKDLGIKYTPEDVQKYLDKSMSKIEYVDSIPDSNSGIRYSGQVEQKLSFSEEEVSARINKSEWQYFPFSNVQTRFNKNGSLEFSATLETSKVKGLIQAVGSGAYTGTELEKALTILNKFGPNPPFYAKITPTAQNNVWKVTAQKIQVGKLPIPLKMIQADSTLSSLANQITKLIPGLNVGSFSIGDGVMNVDATVPNILTIAKQ